jgi:hypothetical protein
MTASGQKKIKRKLPLGILSQQKFYWVGTREACHLEKEKDLQFNISHSVAKTRCIFIGSLAKSGYEIIFG